ncbi:MAG: WD40/YVTN/BNR-like repeat-containing protein [Gemmatimonadota bacterium]
MRLVIGTDDGVRVARWIPGERSARLQGRELDGEPVTALARSRTRVYAATRSGEVHRSDDRGGQWERASTLPEDRGVTALCALPRHPDTLFAGTEPAALFSSHDAGGSWTEQAAFADVASEEEWRGYGDREAHVRTLGCDPRDDRRMYAGVEVGGAYRTDDGGRSWRPINDGLYDDIHVLAADPNHGSRVYAATGGGLYTSVDRGADWRAQEGPLGEGYCTDMVLEDLGEETRLFVATTRGPPATWEGDGGPGAEIHKSDDAGESWRELGLEPLYPSREAFTAVATEPERQGGVFVATSEGALHYGDPEMEGWSRLVRGLPTVHALVVA